MIRYPPQQTFPLLFTTQNPPKHKRPMRLTATTSRAKTTTRIAPPTDSPSLFIHCLRRPHRHRPFDYPPFPFRTSPFLFLVLFFFLFALPACPEPPIQSDGSSENTEGGVEKTESTAESTPEESAPPEESTSPEDGATSEEPYIETEPERPETPDTTEPTLTLIEGDDDQPQPISYPSGTTPPADAKPASFRFRTSWRIYGANLLRIERWELHSKDNTQTFTLTATDKKDTDMKLTLPAALTAGFFTLLGFIGNTSVVKAETFVLQGKDGKDGKDGAQGPKGDIGDNKFTDNDATLLKALLTKLQANGNKLIITADEISFESTAGTEAGKMTIDSAKKELTFSTGTTIFSLTNTQINANASQINLTTPTFEIKSTATNPTTSLKLDDTARSIYLRVAQKNSNPSIQATFSLEGGDANTSPAPVTKYPLAIFNSTNIQVQSGLGFTAPPGPMPTDPPRTNSLGNLIIGYNENPSGGSFARYRDGSNNLMIGSGHSYSQKYGWAFVAGQNNTASGAHSSVSGGQGNAASGAHSSVSGGQGNTASGAHSSVSGGQGNNAGQDTRPNPPSPPTPASHAFV